MFHNLVPLNMAKEVLNMLVLFCLPATIRDLFFIGSGITDLLFKIEFSLQFLSLSSVGLDSRCVSSSPLGLVAGRRQAFQYEVHISL